MGKTDTKTTDKESEMEAREEALKNEKRNLFRDTEGLKQTVSELEQVQIEAEAKLKVYSNDMERLEMYDDISKEEENLEVTKGEQEKENSAMDSSEILENSQPSSSSVPRSSRSSSQVPSSSVSRSSQSSNEVSSNPVPHASSSSSEVTSAGTATEEVFVETQSRNENGRHPTAQANLNPNANEFKSQLDISAINKLPAHIIHKWNDYAFKYVESMPRNHGGYPGFESFVKFVSEQARQACFASPTLEAERETQGNGRPNYKEAPRSKNARSFATEAAVTNNQRDRNVKKYTCIYCKQAHVLGTCNKFTNIPIQERRYFVKDRRLCLNCLRQGHVVKFCRNPNRCRTCNRPHHTLLHNETIPFEQRVPENRIETGEGSPHNKGEQANQRAIVHKIDLSKDNTFYRTQALILPIWVHSHDFTERRVLTYAMLDHQSNTSFINKDSLFKRLNLDGSPVDLSIKTISGTEFTKSVKCKNLILQGLRSKERLHLRSSYVREDIAADKESIPNKEIATTYKHLHEIYDKIEPEIPTLEVEMLIGITYIKRRNCIIKCSQERLRLISELFVITYSKCKPALITETAIYIYFLSRKRGGPNVNFHYSANANIFFSIRECECEYFILIFENANANIILYDIMSFFILNRNRDSLLLFLFISQTRTTKEALVGNTMVDMQYRILPTVQYWSVMFYDCLESSSSSSSLLEVNIDFIASLIDEPVEDFESCFKCGAEL
ncbi:hypothetical protein Anas_13690 [Armadillidium nasatum]|uniref:CCHC-type domain-containing protein n=1 Tax=Armadillidium nasatum TaxID=96803 RepID=A0A5N5T463_9CRUS|nr:hypothetical protein Anas_13690 [Armadillidium nasatum]